jgi:hypothetical protein
MDAAQAMADCPSSVDEATVAAGCEPHPDMAVVNISCNLGKWMRLCALVGDEFAIEFWKEREAKDE